MWKLAIWLIRRSPGRPLGRRDPASICPDVEQQHLKALLYVIVLSLELFFSFFITGWLARPHCCAK